MAMKTCWGIHVLSDLVCWEAMKSLGIVSHKDLGEPGRVFRPGTPHCWHSAGPKGFVSWLIAHQALPESLQLHLPFSCFRNLAKSFVHFRTSGLAALSLWEGWGRKV